MSDADKTNIQWTDFSWNCWQGCHKVSDGCKNCYMYTDKKRYGQTPDVVVRSKDSTFNKPIARHGRGDKKGLYKIKDGSKVFVCSWSDFFHPDADEWRPEAWKIIKERKGVIFQIVTKRTYRMADGLPEDWGDGYDNVWLIVSVENTAMLPRVEKLLQIPAKVRGVSYEPALELVDFKPYLFAEEGEYIAIRDGSFEEDIEVNPPTPRIDWVICGGESGNNARPFQLDWARKVIKDCKEAEVACFVKQLGAMPMKDDEHVFFRHEKGGDSEQWPEEFRVQEYPV